MGSGFSNVRLKHQKEDNDTIVYVCLFGHMVRLPSCKKSFKTILFDTLLYCTGRQQDAFEYINLVSFSHKALLLMD